MLLVRTTKRSPFLSSFTGTNTEAPSSRTFHALSTFNDILRARSSTLFLCVHSSNISESPSRNIKSPAVSKSPRSILIKIVVASNTLTSIFPSRSACTPGTINFQLFTKEIALLRGSGKNILVTVRLNV